MSKRTTASLDPLHPSKRFKMGSSGSKTDGAAAYNTQASGSAVPDPGSLLTDANATSVMSAYVGSLRNNLSEHNAVYTCAAAYGGGFTCSVVLPFNSPVREASSAGPFRSKQLAKQSAAFNAVLALMEAGEIAPSLAPTPANPTIKRKPSAPAETNPTGAAINSTVHAPQPRGHDSISDGPGPRSVVASGSRTTSAPSYRPPHPDEVARNEARAALAKLPRSSSGILGEADYELLASPTFWIQHPLSEAKQTASGHTLLHATIVTLKFQPPHAAVADQCRALCFLSARPVPVTEDVLELDVAQQKVAASAIFTRTPGQLKLSSAQLDKAFEYTRRFMRALLNKPLDGEFGTTAYLVLPFRTDFARDSSARTCSVEDISWTDVDAVDKDYVQVFKLDDPKALAVQLEDAVISAPQELGRRFYASRLRLDLSPQSKSAEAPDKTLFEVAMSNERYEYRYRQVTSLLYPDQPIVEGEHAVGPKGGGLVAALAQPKQKGMLLIPELLSLHFIPASVFRTGTVLPAALASLDDELIAAQLSSDHFHGALDRNLAREAITCPAARPFPGQTNYERLEMLGDTVLKLISTVDVYIDITRKTEGTMTRDRHMVVSNNALQMSAIKSDVVKYIRSMYRRARDFVPPTWVVEGATEAVAPKTQKLGDKTVADVAEALIAAAYLSNNRDIQATLDAMHVLCIPLTLKTWASLLPDPRDSSSRGSAPLTLLGYEFQDGDRGRAAISLYPDASRKAQFERYEFLGDAVIDYLTLEPIWDSNPSLGPAPLTHMKHSRVANAAFSAFMVCTGLSSSLQDIDPATSVKLAAFTQSMLAAQAKADNAIARGNPQHEFWSSVPEHKWLGDILEALFGAILEDSGFDLAVCARVYNAHLGPFVDRYAVGPHAHSLHPKSALLELFAARGCHQWTIEKGVLATNNNNNSSTNGNGSAGVLKAKANGSAYPNGHAAIPTPAPQATIPSYSAQVHVHGVTFSSAAASPQLAVRNACAIALEVLRGEGPDGCACKAEGKA